MYICTVNFVIQFNINNIEIKQNMCSSIFTISASHCNYANIHSMPFTLYTTSQYTQYVIYTIYNQPVYTVCHLHYIQPD